MRVCVCVCAHACMHVCSCILCINVLVFTLCAFILSLYCGCSSVCMTVTNIYFRLDF